MDRIIIPFATEVAKNVKINMTLSGWPAATAIVGGLLVVGGTIVGVKAIDCYLIAGPQLADYTVVHK